MVNREWFLRTIRMKKNGRQRFARLKIFQSDDRDMVILTDHVTIPYIEGDGVGHEITPVSQKIVNAAIKQAYNGTRSIEWKEVLAGLMPKEEVSGKRIFFTPISSVRNFNNFCASGVPCCHSIPA